MSKPTASQIALMRVLSEVADERARQTHKHGDQSHLPNGTGGWYFGTAPLIRRLGITGSDLAGWARDRCKSASQNEGGNGSVTFEHILTEEYAEALAETDPAALRAELIQVAAVAVQWVEAIDRRDPTSTRCTCGTPCQCQGGER